MTSQPHRSPTIRTHRQLFSFLRLFHEHAGWRLPGLFGLILFAGAVEALGLVTLVPLLDAALGDSNTNRLSEAILSILSWLSVQPTILNLLLLIIFVFLIRAGLIFASNYYMYYILVDVRRRLQIDLAKKFGLMEYSYYVLRSSGWFSNILISEIARLVSSMRNFTLVGVNIINVLILLPVALSIKPGVTLTIFVIASITLLCLRGIISSTAAYSHKQTKLQGKLNATFIELIQSFIYLKATGSTDTANQHVIASVDALARTELRIRRLASFMLSIKDPIAVVILAGFIFYEMHVKGGSLSEAIVIMLILYRILVQLVSIAPQLQTFNQTIGGVFVVNDVLRDIEPRLEVPNTSQPANLNEPIHLKDVSFYHQSSPILRQLNISIPPNKTIGIVGPSGAGKTTFFHILTGLLSPTSGKITIGDHSYEEIDIHRLRQQIGYVTQEPVIFDDTVANNISLWRCEPNDEECAQRVIIACQLAQCDAFIQNMENGYNTVVGDRGVRLSGGERQRVAIARELFKNPKLLIFDEASSSLDAHSELYVQQGINSMHGERTIIIISHRLASVRDCDEIFVFSDGKIVESGTFDELYRSPDSLFRQMCIEQGVGV